MASAKQATQTAQAPPQEEEFVNSVLDGEASVAPKRYFTIPGRDPFDEIEWETRDALIPGKSGPVFEQRDVESIAQGVAKERFSSEVVGVGDRSEGDPQRAGGARRAKDEVVFYYRHRFPHFGLPEAQRRRPVAPAAL